MAESNLRHLYSAVKSIQAGAPARVWKGEGRTLYGTLTMARRSCPRGTHPLLSDCTFYKADGSAHTICTRPRFGGHMPPLRYTRQSFEIHASVIEGYVSSCCVGNQ